MLFIHQQTYLGEAAPCWCLFLQPISVLITACFFSRQKHTKQPPSLCFDVGLYLLILIPKHSMYGTFTITPWCSMYEIFTYTKLGKCSIHGAFGILWAYEMYLLIWLRSVLSKNASPVHPPQRKASMLLSAMSAMAVPGAAGDVSLGLVWCSESPLNKTQAKFCKWLKYEVSSGIFDIAIENGHSQLIYL